MARQGEHRSSIRRLFVALSIAASSIVLPATAFAQTEPYSGNEPEVLPERVEREEPQEAPSGAQERPSGGVLPVTGAELTLFAVTGLAAIKTGATLVRRAR